MALGATEPAGSLLAEAIHPVPVRRQSGLPEYCNSLEQYPRWSVVGTESSAVQEPLFSGVPILAPVRLEPLDIEIPYFEHPALDRARGAQQLENPDGLALAHDDDDVQLARLDHVLGEPMGFLGH